MYIIYVYIYIFLIIFIDALCAAVFHLLQTLLPSGKNQKEGKKKGQFRFSTKEAQDAFIIVCQNEASYKEYYDAKVRKEKSVQPYITIIGTLLSPREIFVDFENIMYKMASLPKAIDVCFKSHFVFSIEYNPAARYMWQFLNQYFYHLKDDKTYPAVHMIIKLIKGNLLIILRIIFSKSKGCRKFFFKENY